MAHIKYYLKTETNNILDTKIASKLARSYSDNHSLKILINFYKVAFYFLFLIFFLVHRVFDAGRLHR